MVCFTFSFFFIFLVDYAIDSADKEYKKRLAIFSVHVHPDGSRIATGGLGTLSL